MPSCRQAYVPWRERAFVTPAETAEIFARSLDWVRNRAGEGCLDLRRLSRGGPVVITVDSVVALIERTGRCPRPTKTSPEASHLRLVVDNDA